MLSNPFDIGITTRNALQVIEVRHPDPFVSFEQVKNTNWNSESNGCLMRITPLAVWGYRLQPEDLYEAVKLQTALTHSNKTAIDSCYLYCFAIGHLINHGDPQLAYKLTKEEAKKYSGKY